MVAVLYSRPVAANEIDPCFGASYIGLLAAEVVSFFYLGLAALFFYATAVEVDDRFAVGEPRRHRKGGTQAHRSFFDPTVSYAGLGKGGEASTSC